MLETYRSQSFALALRKAHVEVLASGLGLVSMSIRIVVQEQATSRSLKACNRTMEHMKPVIMAVGWVGNVRTYIVLSS